MTKAQKLLEDMINESSDLDDMVRHYVVTMLWAGTEGDHGTPLDDNYGPEDVSKEAMDQIKKECAEFLKKATPLIEKEDNPDYELVGHDFFLTRNHHGAGFWDGDWKEGDELTKIAHSFGESDPYVGDDGKIYIL